MASLTELRPITTVADLKDALIGIEDECPVLGNLKLTLVQSAGLAHVEAQTDYTPVEPTEP